MSSDGSRYDGDARVGARPCQRGTDGRVERRGDHLRRVPHRRRRRRSPVRRWRSPRPCSSAAPIATVGPCAESSSTAGPVSGPSPTRVAPRVDVTPRIWSTMSPAPLVAIALRPGSPTRCSASRSACAYVRRRHAHPLGQRLEPIEPVDRRVLAGAGMRRCGRPGVGCVVDDVAARHRVHGDQQVGVDGQAHRAAHLAAGVDLRAGREVDRRQQDVEPAARSPARSRGRRRSAAPVWCRPARPPPAAAGRRAATSWSARTGLEVSGGTTAVSVSAEESAAGSGGTPSTGSRKRASSRRAGAP